LSYQAIYCNHLGAASPFLPPRPVPGGLNPLAVIGFAGLKPNKFDLAQYRHRP